MANLLRPSTEQKLIKEIFREYAEASKLLEKYFGVNCLRTEAFKIKTLGTACLLFDVNRNAFLQDFDQFIERSRAEMIK